jgi:hypothetical protein
VALVAVDKVMPYRSETKISVSRRLAPAAMAGRGGLPSQPGVRTLIWRRAIAATAVCGAGGGPS